MLTNPLVIQSLFVFSIWTYKHRSDLKKYKKIPTPNHSMFDPLPAGESIQSWFTVDSESTHFLHDHESSESYHFPLSVSTCIISVMFLFHFVQFHKKCVAILSLFHVSFQVILHTPTLFSTIAIIIEFRRWGESLIHVGHVYTRA